MPHIRWQTTVVRDGWHNMGTDLCFWRDCYWLVYSRNAAHASPEGTIVVMRSLDLKRWHTVTVIDSGLDDRDPKLLATDDRLCVYFFGCRFNAVNGELRQTGHTYLSSSANGVSWTTPVPIHKSNYLGGVVPADTYTSGFLSELDDRALRMTGPADIFLAEIDTEEEGREVRF